MARAQASAYLRFHVCFLNAQQLSYFPLSTSLRPLERWQQTKSQERVTPTSACSGHRFCGRSLCVLGLSGKQCPFAQGSCPAVPHLDFPNPHLHILLAGLVLPSLIMAWAWTWLALGSTCISPSLSLASLRFQLRWWCMCWWIELDDGRVRRGHSS